MIFSDVFDFYNKIKGKKLAFIGIGVSHEDLIKRCAEAGALVTLCDKRDAADIKEAEELLSLGVTLKTGADYLENIDADIVFRTPGMYFNHPALLSLRKKGVCVTSEMEMFFSLCPCKIYAITGSDGKTTTSNIIARLLSESGKKVHLGGNLGRALLPVCDKISKDDVAVVELSSFQLISMRQSPDVAVITNVAPNHLDVHGTMEEYIDSKKNIFSHQDAFGRLVLNLDNDITRALCGDARGAVEWFSYKNKKEFLENDYIGTYLDENGDIYRKTRGGCEKIMHKSLIKIVGEHNVENYLTAIAAVGEEVSAETIRSVAENFSGVEHRIEFVRELDGVKYYNDSIASSPTRTIAGLKSFNKKVILIAGGYDKKIPFEPLAPFVYEKVCHLVLQGTTAKKIREAIENFETNLPLPEITEVKTVEEATLFAHQIAKEGDVVLLSPACASFDQYRNFELRGKHFKEIVNSL